jgi:hypothetical protein
MRVGIEPIVVLKRGTRERAYFEFVVSLCAGVLDSKAVIAIRVNLNP